MKAIGTLLIALISFLPKIYADCSFDVQVNNYFYCNTGVEGVAVTVYNCFTPASYGPFYTNSSGTATCTRIPNGCYDIVAWNYSDCNGGTYNGFSLDCTVPPGTPLICLSAPACDNNNSNGIKLFQNYPNPFNPVTKISYSISSFGKVKITVYDLLGKEITVLVNEYKGGGNYSVNFDASNLSSGIYIYKMETTNFVDIKRMLVVK